MKNFLFMTIAVSIAIFAGCRKSDIRTFEIKVPEMKNEMCVTIISSNLVKQAGVNPKKTRFSVEKRTVTVTYDSMMTAKKNIEFAVAEAGFAANQIPVNADAQSKLPPECK